ncbi:MAG: hypothetical protein NVSMB9_25400 [Isosphaeraceae bacterium]
MTCSYPTAITGALLTFVIGFTVVPGSRSAEPAAPSAEPKLAHMVFFTLKDRSPEAREKLAASCRKNLGAIEGSVHFSVGTIAEDVVEPGVSIRDFDVSLHIIFETKEAEAKYLKDPRHVTFVDENKASFASVRVFDSYLTNP